MIVAMGLTLRVLCTVCSRACIGRSTVLRSIVIRAVAVRSVLVRSVAVWPVVACSRLLLLLAGIRIVVWSMSYFKIIPISVFLIEMVVGAVHLSS